MTINDRIGLIIKDLGLNNNSFSVIVGTNPTVIHNIVKGRNAPGFELFSKIALSFDNINMNWLITGNGSMHVQEKPELSIKPIIEKPRTKQKDQPGCALCKIKDDMIKMKDELIDSLRQQIDTQSKLIQNLE